MGWETEPFPPFEELLANNQWCNVDYGNPNDSMDLESKNNDGTTTPSFTTYNISPSPRSTFSDPCFFREEQDITPGPFSTHPPALENNQYISNDLPSSGKDLSFNAPLFPNALGIHGLRRPSSAPPGDLSFQDHHQHPSRLEQLPTFERDGRFLGERTTPLRSAQKDKPRHHPYHSRRHQDIHQSTHRAARPAPTSVPLTYSKSYASGAPSHPLPAHQQKNIVGSRACTPEPDVFGESEGGDGKLDPKLRSQAARNAEGNIIQKVVLEVSKEELRDLISEAVQKAIEGLKAGQEMNGVNGTFLRSE